MADLELALLISVEDQPGSLWRVTQAIFEHGANVTYISSTRGVGETQIELNGVADSELLLTDLERLEVVKWVRAIPLLNEVFGKRVIVIGGGAQVGMVAQGAIAEADRHNIRGERISVDTIPLVGEEQLAGAVRAVARLHRAQVLVLAGALMGGDISLAVTEVRAMGVIVLCTSMAGSLVRAVDAVIGDPLEAGVMAVMLVADTAQFSIEKIRGRRF